MATPTPPQKPPPNLYTRRLTPPTAPKPCYICSSPTSTVLITLCTRDFFYTCPGHLLDRGFASPCADPFTVDPGAATEAAVIAKLAPAERERKLAEEMGRVSAEIEVRKVKRKAAAKAAKERKAKQEKDKNGKAMKDDTDPSLDAPVSSAAELGTESGDERERKVKVEGLKKKYSGEAEVVDAKDARSFKLHMSIYNMRMQKMRDVAAAKGRKAVSGGSTGGGGARMTVATPSAFPSVPRTGFG